MVMTCRLPKLSVNFSLPSMSSHKTPAFLPVFSKPICARAASLTFVGADKIIGAVFQASPVMPLYFVYLLDPVMMLSLDKDAFSAMAASTSVLLALSLF